MKKHILSAVLLLAALIAPECKAGIYAQGTYLTTATNALFFSTPLQIWVPPTPLTITCTNANTVITNTIGNTLYVGGTNIIPAITFIYTASTMGTNFSTNFAGYYLTFTNYTFGTATPQAGGTNTATIN